VFGMSEIPELGGMKMFETSNTASRILLSFLIIGIVGLGLYGVFLDGQIVALKGEVAVLQEQNLVDIVDANNSFSSDFSCQNDQNKIKLTICGSFVKYPVKPKSMEEVNEIISNFGRCIPDENNLINECQLCSTTRNIGWQCIDKNYLESIQQQKGVSS